MPPRSKVDTLPDEVRSELNRRLVDNGFAEYEDLADWLQAKGFEISKSSLGRYGKTFKERTEMLRMVTEQARVIVEEAPDDEGAVNEALMRLTQERLFQVMMALNINPEEVDLSTIDLSKIARSVADLGKASVMQKKWQVEVREKAQAAAAEVEEIVREGGLTDDAAKKIRAQILGIAS